MTIEAITKDESAERLGLLATLALATSPSLHDRILTDAEKRELEQITKKIRGGDQNRIDEYLANEISRAVLGNSDVDAILAKAGSEGRLTPGLYTVEIGEAFRQSFRAFRVRDSDVTSAVSQADDLQHLEMADDNSLSLFVKYVDFGPKHEPFWAIAQLHRKGRELVAHCYWRLYPNDIDISGASMPEHLVHALVSRFGLPLRVNGQERAYFRNYTLPPEVEAINFQYEHRMPNSRVPSSIMTASQLGKTPLRSAKVIIAYAMDTLKYAEYLQRHGVELRP